MFESYWKSKEVVEYFKLLVELSFYTTNKLYKMSHLSENKWWYGCIVQLNRFLAEKPFLSSHRIDRIEKTTTKKLQEPINDSV